MKVNHFVINNHINLISRDKHPEHNSAAFLIGRTHAEYCYKTVDKIEEDVELFIEEIQDTLIEIAKKIENEYFKY